MSLTRKTIDADDAKRAIEAAVEKAVELGIRITVAITDESGGLKALWRDDGAMPISVEIATNKAYTAAVGGLPTHVWHEVIKDDPPLLHGLPQTNRIVIFGGGIPIAEDGQTIGAVGISGGHYSQDIECANAAVAALAS